MYPYPMLLRPVLPEYVPANHHSECTEADRLNGHSHCYRWSVTGPVAEMADEPKRMPDNLLRF